MPGASRSAAVVWVALALLGASAGLGVADAWGRGRARGAPDGWRRVASPARYASPARLGELRLDGRAWALQFNEALVADAPSSRVEVTVSVGALGRVLVAPAADGGSPPAFVLARGERPRFVANGAPIACEGELPPVDQAPYTLRVAREGDRWVARAADGVLRCAGPADGPPRVQAGVRRVHVRALADARGPVAPPLGFAAAAACVLLGALGGCAVAWVDRRASPAMLAAYAPLALGVLGFGADIGPLLAALRVEPTPVPVAALGVGLAVLGRGAVAAWALARRDAPPPAWLVAASGLPAAAAVYFGSGQRLLPATLLVAAGIPLGARALQWACTGVPHGWGAAIVGATAGAAGLSAIGLADPVARLYAVSAGAALGALLWVQARVRQPTAYNLASLGLVALALASVELGVRRTALGAVWGDVGGRAAGGAAATVARYRALERQPVSSYPIEFPVPAPRRDGRPRVVCLGGSSMGGAAQNDDLRSFFPARLEERLGGAVQVVNQGASGWNTFHIKTFVASHLDMLDPDIVVAYVGVNERTPAPASEEEMYARYRAGATLGVATTLERLRVYNAVRFLARHARGYGDVAVPLAHSRANLDAIARAARATGARTLLVGEASQGPTALDAALWSEMARLGAAADDVAFWSAAEALSPDAPELFLDDNHLSDAGHARLAAALADVLVGLGWLAPPGE